jgi:hypothetical protein
VCHPFQVRYRTERHCELSRLFRVVPWQLMCSKPGMGDASGPEGITQHNEEFHWRVQKVRRIALILTSLLLCAALMGLLGSGPLSSVRTVSADSSLGLEYPRFARFNAPIDLIIRAEPAKGDNRIQVRIDDRYLRAFEVEHISPPPLETRSEPGASIYVFESTGPAVIKFSLLTGQFGRISGSVGTSAGEPLIVRHFVYP